MTAVPPPSARRPSLVALVLVTGVGPIGTDTYVAALPQVRHALATSASLAQLTITAFIIGIAAGQLIFGPISDGRGRRGMLLASSAVFTLASLLCALAPTAPVLLAGRLVQGLAGGCGVALGRAVVSDRYRGAEAAKRFGTLMSITLLGPVVAPAIGGVVLLVGDWRTVFVLLVGIGALMTLAVALGVPETLPAQLRHAGGLRSALARMGSLVGERAFRAPVAVQCLASAGFFTYIGGSSFVLQGELGISAREYAVVFASNAAAMAIASLSFRLLVARVGPGPLRTLGLAMSTVSAATLAVVAGIAHAPSLIATWVLLALAVAGMGLCIPGTTTIAQQVGRRYGGTASALQGGLVFVAGAAATPLTGLTGHESVAVLSLIMTACFVLACLVLVATRRVVPVAGEVGSTVGEAVDAAPASVEQ